MTSYRRHAATESPTESNDHVEWGREPPVYFDGSDDEDDGIFVIGYECFFCGAGQGEALVV